MQVWDFNRALVTEICEKKLAQGRSNVSSEQMVLALTATVTLLALSDISTKIRACLKPWKWKDKVLKMYKII